MSKVKITKTDFNNIIKECACISILASNDYGAQLNLISMICSDKSKKLKAEYKEDTTKEYKKRLSEAYDIYAWKIYDYLNNVGYYDDCEN